MVKNKPSTSSLHATQTPLSASTTMSPNMPEKLPIRSLGAEASNSRQKTLEDQYAMWEANRQEEKRQEEQRKLDMKEEWKEEWKREEKRQEELRWLAIIEELKQEKKRQHEKQHSKRMMAEKHQTENTGRPGGFDPLTEREEIQLALEKKDRQYIELCNQIVKDLSQSEETPQRFAKDTSAPSTRPRSSSIENEQRLEETWAQTYSNATPAIKTTQPSLYEMMPKIPQQPSYTGIGNGYTNGGETLFQRYHEFTQKTGKNSLIGNGLRMQEAMIAKQEYKLKEPEEYAEPFINFMTENPTIWHAIHYWENKLEKAGFSRVSFSILNISVPSTTKDKMLMIFDL